MATGVVGMSGVNARKAVALVFKHEIGVATTQHQPMAEKIAPPMVHSIWNL